MKYINLGCGFLNRQKGEIGIDTNIACKPDVCGDIQNLPFKDESINTINAIHVLEHVKDIVKVMNECWRVLKAGGEFNISVPLFPTVGSIADPTHVRYFVPESFGYFCRKGALTGLNNLFTENKLNISKGNEILCQLRK